MRRDHEEVCSLSRRVMLQPVSRPLQPGLRFFPVPVPAPPWADLAACCPRRERYGVSTFRLQKYVGLGACYRPGGIWVTKTYLPGRCSHLQHRFGASVVATSACFSSRSLSQIQMFSPYRLSGTSPARGCQKGTPLAIDTPHLAVLRYVVGAALYSGSWIHPVTQVVPSVAVGTTSTSDIVSQGKTKSKRVFAAVYNPHS